MLSLFAVVPRQNKRVGRGEREKNSGTVTAGSEHWINWIDQRTARRRAAAL